MDIIAILRKKINLLEAGEHTSGLKAVLSHVETAYRHLKHGQKEADQTAFTDAVYRTNQAFEGGIKEAYRVLTKKPSEKIRPFDIEIHFSKSKTFRPRVLDQFSNYRKEWRNPSTHDYKLDFNESESFLAIVSVTAFSCLLLDEIAQQLAHDKELFLVKNIVSSVREEICIEGMDLLTQTTEALKAYFLNRSTEQIENSSEPQWLGSVSGFLTAVLPDATIETEVSLGLEKSHVMADILVVSGQEKVIVEIKNRLNKLTIKLILNQVEHIMLSANIKNGVVLFLPTLLETNRIFEGVNELPNGMGYLHTISPIKI